MNKFEIQSPANIEAVNCITQKLGVYNRETYGPSGRESFSITQSKNGQLIAGASGLITIPTPCLFNVGNISPPILDSF